MASNKIEHYFYDGKNGCKNGKTGPGILVVEGKFKFRMNKCNKDGTIYKYYCVQQGNPEFACKAKATIVRREDNSFYLYSCDIEHNHLVTKSAIIAEELKQRMADLVRKDPVAPVGDAIRSIKLEAAEEFGDDEELLNEIVDSLGSFHSMELRLFRVRNSIIGPNPKSRDHFDPNHFLKKIYGEGHKVVTLDSNKLSDDWQSAINKSNPNSKYYWEKLNENMKDYEDDRDEEVNENENSDTVDDVAPDDALEGGPEEPPSSSKNLPKRVVAYTSTQLLQLFSKCKRGSLDGTFKSCCKLWKQQFVFMLKHNGHWIPAVWGWLPDKTEISYKVFLHLVLGKIMELQIPFNVEEIITDFELNIHKAVDDMLPSVCILGCYFHLAKAFKKKVDKKNMKRNYETNDKFRRFIKQAIALSSLPLDDLQVGLDWLKDSITFVDEKEATFKTEFLKYIEDYWINGCFPPHTWSTWNRATDYTNNNQEGFNSKMNKELKQTHPSPGILLSFIRKQILLSHHKIAESKVAEKPRKMNKHKKMAHKRFDLKKSYENAKIAKNVNIKQLVGEYLSIMGHNIVSSTMIGRLTDIQYSQAHTDDDNDQEVGETDVSSWQIHENTIVDEMFECENPYIGRKVGISKNTQEDQEARAEQWWRGAICPSCNKGFNSKSVRKECHSCEKSTHNRKTCLSMGDDSTVFLCRACKPVERNIMKPTPKTSDGFKCDCCNFKTMFKYNLQRHMELKHKGEQSQPEHVINEISKVVENKTQKEDSEKENNLETMLKDLDLENLFENFVAEAVDLKMLLSFNESDMKDCMKDIGIKRFGDRHKIIEKIRQIKRNTKYENEKHINNEPLVEQNFSTEILLQESCEVIENDDNMNDVSLVEMVPEKECDLCTTSKHTCRLCGKAVCNLFCSIPDPSSDNEMYRIHNSGDNRCAQNSVQSPGQVHEHNGSVHESFQSFTSAVISSNLVYESASFECPSCGKVFRSSKLLQEHIDHEHAEDNSRTSLTLQSVADNSDWMYAKCTLCEKRFQSESDMEFHVQRFHEYGEECALYPCELCGYRGQDVDALRGHISENHEENTEKSSIHIQDSPEVVPDLVVNKRIVQNLKGIDFDDDSDDDKEWTPTKNCSEAEILFSCNFCEFQTKYPNNLERHKQLHKNNKKRKTLHLRREH